MTLLGMRLFLNNFIGRLVWHDLYIPDLNGLDSFREFARFFCIKTKI